MSSKAEQFLDKLEEAKDPAVVAKKILEAGESHPIFKVLSTEMDRLKAGLKEAQKRQKGLEKAGAGDTETVTMVMSFIFPKLQRLASQASKLEEQMQKEFAGHSR